MNIRAFNLNLTIGENLIMKYEEYLVNIYLEIKI